MNATDDFNDRANSVIATDANNDRRPIFTNRTTAEQVSVTRLTDDSIDARKPRALAALPRGYVKARCPRCTSMDLIGILATNTADDSDPNIACNNCGYWWD